MDKIQKNEIYDQMSKLLTEYEEDKGGKDLHKNYEMDLYLMLVKIQNSWEEITGDG